MVMSNVGSCFVMRKYRFDEEEEGKREREERRIFFLPPFHFFFACSNFSHVKGVAVEKGMIGVRAGSEM